MGTTNVVADTSHPKRPRYRSALIIDPDLAYIGAVRDDPSLREREFDLATGGQSAEKLLSDPLVRYSAIFIDATVYAPTLLPLIRFVRRTHPATPLYLTYARTIPLLQSDMWKLGIQEALKKPFPATAFAARTRPSRPPLAAVQAQPTAPEGWTSLIAQGASPAAVALDDSTYVPVIAEEFLSGRPSPYDAYVRVAPGKYVKVLNAKDSIEPERVQRFIQLGAHHLYIRKQPMARCLMYANLLESILLTRPDVSPELRLLQLAFSGEAANRMIRANGGKPLSAGHLNVANQFLSQLALLVKQTRKNQKELVADFLRHAGSIEHAVSVSFAVALLAPEVGIESPSGWAQLGLAAFFHDIGLYGLPEKLISLDTIGIVGGTMELLRPEELGRYQQHPFRSVEILSANRAFEQSTLLSVLQHHERRDKTGFPKRLGPDQITPMAELIGIADEFIRLLKRQSQDQEFKAIEAMENEVFNGFSFRTIKAFRTIFMS
ncbi:MAG TPA: HD domain-containing phosphohydrolase [Bdellovibrionota bacterium]|nr:HD domain-containing phosphohydrolase [Bdellovibrionota bacterium]